MTIAFVKSRKKKRKRITRGLRLLSDDCKACNCRFTFSNRMAIVWLIGLHFCTALFFLSSDVGPFGADLLVLAFVPISLSLSLPCPLLLGITLWVLLLGIQRQQQQQFHLGIATFGPSFSWLPLTKTGTTFRFILQSVDCALLLWLQYCLVQHTKVRTLLLHLDTLLHAP